MSLPKPLRGIVVPMVTPLRGRDSLDAEGLERLIEHVLDGGVHGLFVLGTTGEGPSLSRRLRRELVRRTCGQVAGRVPVLVGITDTSFVESVSLAHFAASEGADAVVLAPPFYFPAGQPELLEYLEHLVPQLPLPLFLYNMPSHTKLFFEPDTVRKAAGLDGVVGIKDSSGDMAYFHRIVQLMDGREGFTVLVGPEGLLAEAVALGGHGGVAGGANIHPRLFVDTYEAAVRRDMSEVRRLHEAILAFRRLYGCGRHASSFIKGVKCALSCMGICDDFMAEPFHAFRAPEREQVRRRLEALGVPPGPSHGTKGCSRAGGSARRSAVGPARG